MCSMSDVDPEADIIDHTWYTRSDDAPLAVSAGGVIVRVEQDRVLVALAQQRAVPGYVLPKGNIDPGESLEQAARREIAEETGFTNLTLLDDLGIRERYNRAKTRWKRTRYFLFLTQQIDATPLESDRHGPPAWFPLDALPSIAWPEQLKLIESRRDDIARLATQAHADAGPIARVDHVNIVVRNTQPMIEFYRDVLGMKVTKDVNIGGDWIEQVVGLKDVEARVVYLELPAGPRLELIEYDSPTMIDSDQLGQPQMRGLRHLAFAVNDIDAVHRRLDSAGVRFISSVQQVPDAQVTYDASARKHLVYFRDPEDNLLELCQYRA